ncbi:MAG: helix-turn-helix domain-containing protein [Chthoniobacter sp.]|uniref:winged helix-turn-helix transcriptional regulator n=1 Tax=Chthoniobacter sp. TaxID=2510640 RepID=UPI0032A5C558
MIPKSQWRSPCPIACTLDIIGDRWTLLVVRDLLFGKRYFDEFLASPEGIATNILSARLAWLTELKLARRVPAEHDKRRVAYELTDKGQTLKQVLRETARWGMAHFHGETGPLNPAAVRRATGRAAGGWVKRKGKRP